jgi:hypothetical protein
MFIGITRELDNGQEARIRFQSTPEGGASVKCEEALGCRHELGQEQVASLFRSLDVDYGGDALASVRVVIQQDKVEHLFRALHTITWSDEATTELLELYLTGFTPQMLAQHFQVGIRAIIRHLSFVVWGDEHLTQDPTKSRHQKPWHQDEILFLASQMQIGRTPTEISTLMDRDSLGIAFKLFEALPVPIPRAVQNHYNVTVRNQPLGQVPLDGKPF